MEFITLAEALRIIDSGALFDIEYVTADTRRAIGGQLKACSRCVKHMSQPTGDKRSKKIVAATAGSSKPANHKENNTKNIYLTREAVIRKIHIRLITRLNGRLVS